MNKAKTNRNNITETLPVVRHDLKVCPFCGSSPEIRYYYGKRLITCSNVNGQCDVNPGVTGNTEREAVERWERRAG